MSTGTNIGDLVHFLQHTGKPLPLTCTPIKYGSWMGGDRDGNPNVTAKVMSQCLLLCELKSIVPNIVIVRLFLDPNSR